MSTIQDLEPATVEQIIADPGVIRILKRAASRWGIDWEDLRQTLALQLLQLQCNLSVLPVPLNVLHTEIKSIAIDLRRREPRGKLDRLGGETKTHAAGFRIWFGFPQPHDFHFAWFRSGRYAATN